MADVDDDLTGLHARRSFLALLRRHIGYANDRQETLALLVVDLDGFARINSALGYAVGDRVLQHVAAQLRAVTRTRDHAGRIGGDRFALLLPRVMNAGHAELAVQKLFRLLDTPFTDGVHKVRLSATVGIALCPQSGSSVAELCARADRALYDAKRAGKRRVAMVGS